MEAWFFLASKTVGMVARVETWLIAGLALALLAQWRGRRRAGLVWSACCLGVLLALTVFPLGDLLLQRLERQYPARPVLAQIDGIIVLGGAEETGAAAAWGGVQFNDAAERVIAGAVLAQQYPKAKLIFTGGSARVMGAVDRKGPSELTRDLWISLGIAPDRILLEQASRNTAENAAFSFDMVQPAPGQRWVLVTSAYHMPRAMDMFSRAGWQSVVAWPVDFRSGDLARGPTWQFDSGLDGVNTALKEYVGSWVYRMVGK